VVVVAVTAANVEGPAAARFRAALEAELDVLRASGSTVELLIPDAGSVAAFGPNLMDGSRRSAVVEEGYRQGRAAHASFAPVWVGSAIRREA
jgi:NTE family protein